MVYIALGIASLAILLVLLFADKFTPFSAMMSSFKEGTFKKGIVSLSIVTIAFTSYGVYYELTYQPSYLDIQVEGEHYTVFGDVGEFGYYSDTLIKKDAETEMHLVSWGELGLEKAEIIVQYPSGKEDIWEAELSRLKQSSISPLTENYQIQDIHKASLYTFKEKGNVELSITDGEKELSSLKIEVK
ncbi:hypothetical protein GH741_11245 [Aquibacillus halophilus]|uniref:Uncharacterized protein n=1 Tax=Aquibacillus halophilus TaxID=930132 RepID=A0A6A8DC07_9BACI|nr:hypothetical protein [Aquibacillus halophilus]MRH43255.1 hypothetical protein [Aquibacillus halophilus]